MLTLLILVLLGIAFYSGARRGFVLQLVYSLGYLISYWLAQANYRELAPKLEMLIPYPSVSEGFTMVFFDQEIAFDLDQAFYGGAAFLLILFIGWAVTRFIAIFLRGLTFLPLLKQADWLAGGVLSLAVVYIAIFLLLTIATYVPVSFVQQQFESSSLARLMVENTPVLTKSIYDLWVTKMIG